MLLAFAWLLHSFIGSFGSDKLVPLSECAEGYEMNLLLDDGGACLVNYPGAVSTAKSTFVLSKLRLHLASWICTNNYKYSKSCI